MAEELSGATGAEAAVQPIESAANEPDVEQTDAQTSDGDAAAAIDAADEIGAVALVPMVREEPQFVGGPVAADVHPDEIAAYAARGWMPAPGYELATSGEAAAKALDAMSLEELRTVADAEGVAFTPRTLEPRLRADIAEARAKAVANG